MAAIQIVAQDSYNKPMSLGAKYIMNVSVSYETQMSNAIINFDLTEDQVQLTRVALEVATGRNPKTDTLTVEDVARAIALIQLLELFRDVPDLASEEELDRQVCNYMDGVGELIDLLGPFLERVRTKQRISGGNEVKRIALGDRVTIKD